MKIQLSDHFTCGDCSASLCRPMSKMVFASIYGVADGFIVVLRGNLGDASIKSGSNLTGKDGTTRSLYFR